MTPWQGPWRKAAAQAKLNGFRDKHPIKQLHSITIKLHSSLPYVWVTNHFELCRLNLVGHGGAWWGNLSNLKWVQIGGQWLGILWSSHSNLSGCIGPAPCEAAANSPLQRCRMQSPPELVKAVHKGCNHSSLHTFKTRLCSGLLQLQVHSKNIKKCISAISSP